MKTNLLSMLTPFARRGVTAFADREGQGHVVLGYSVIGRRDQYRDYDKLTRFFRKSRNCAESIGRA
jgi:hypothetical protein